jgi:hypothetical protein
MREERGKVIERREESEEYPFDALMYVCMYECMYV